MSEGEEGVMQREMKEEDERRREGVCCEMRSSLSGGQIAERTPGLQRGRGGLRVDSPLLSNVVWMCWSG